MQSSQKRKRGIIWRALGTKPGRRNKSLLRTTGPCLSSPKWSSCKCSLKRIKVRTSLGLTWSFCADKTVGAKHLWTSHKLGAQTFLVLFFFCSQGYHVIKYLDWRDGSVVKKTICCSWRPDFGSQHLPTSASSQAPVTLAPGDPTMSSRLGSYLHTHVQTQTPVQKHRLNLSKRQLGTNGSSCFLYCEDISNLNVSACYLLAVGRRLRWKNPGAGKGAPSTHEKERELGDPRCHSWRGFSEIAPPWPVTVNKEPEQREGGRGEDRLCWKGLVVFAGTLSSCGLKTQDEMLWGELAETVHCCLTRYNMSRGCAVSHRLESWRREEIECGETAQEDMKDNSFLLRGHSWNLTKQGVELRPCLCWHPAGGPLAGHSAADLFAPW